MFQALILSAGGTLETYFSAAPGTTTVTIYNGNGSIIVDAATCTVDSANTTLTTAVEAGDDELTTTDSGELTVGRRYLLSGSGETSEVVTPRSVTGGTSVGLCAPLKYAHAATSALTGLRASYAVSGSSASTLFWDGYAVFTPTVGEAQVEPVDCVRRKIPETLISEHDIRLVIPKQDKALSEELDLQAAFREARDQLLIDFGGKNRAQTFLGVDYFRRPCAIKFWLLRRHEFGDTWKQAMDDLQDEYDRLIQKLIEQSPVDADQDGATTGQNDRGWTSISLERS